MVPFSLRGGANRVRRAEGNRSIKPPPSYSITCHILFYAKAPFSVKRRLQIIRFFLKPAGGVYFAVKALRPLWTEGFYGVPNETAHHCSM